MIRKIFLLLIPVFIMLSPVYAKAAEVTIDGKSFPDEFVRGYVLENIDKNKDGILQDEEAAAVTEILFKKFLDADEMDAEDGDEGTGTGSASQMKYYTEEEFVFDFKGIGYFTNLSKLVVNLTGGRTEGDVRYPVKISNLRSLYKLGGLKQLEIYKADVKSFDCSHFPKIEKLCLNDFDNLKKLTFKKNGKLKTISLASMNKLDTLDVSSLGGLTTLKLETVDLKKLQTGRKNKAIKSLQIDNYANQYCKRMKSIDLSRLTGLKKLYIARMKNIKKLDLSSNKNLQLLFVEKCDSIAILAPKKNKKLTEVSVWNCKKLGTLDLSGNTKLNSLTLDGMKVKTIRLNKKNKLGYFRYANAKLKTFDVKNINAKTLKELQLYGNKLKKVNVRKFKKLENIEVDKGVKVIR